MQPSVFLRNQAFRRSWSGVGWTVLHLHIPQTSTKRALHSQDTDREKESSLDTFVLHFQRILKPKEFPTKYPTKKTSRAKGSRRGKDAKNFSSQISYRPYVKSFSVGGSSKNKPIFDEIQDERDGVTLADRMERGERERIAEEIGEIDGGNGAERERKETNVGERDEITEEKRKAKNNEKEESGERHEGNGEKWREREINGGERDETETEDERKKEMNKETNGEDKEEIKKGSKKTRERTKIKENEKIERMKENKNKSEKEEEERGRGLSKEERAMLCRVLEEVQECRDTEYLELCLRQDEVPEFASLRRLCAGVSRTAAVGTVVAIMRLAKELHPTLYLSHLGLDYYWASALCHAGDVEQSLSILLHLHHQTHPNRQTHPHCSRKVANITQLVLYRIVEEGEDEVAKAVDFVDEIASELKCLSPALSLWSVTFTSPLFRVQQVSEWLVERHPGLVKHLGRRVEGLVEKAAWEGDQNLLQRILHLSLQHGLCTHYPSATSALLQLQCDEGDLRGAEETIKFAQRMSLRLSPASLHRFLALLSRHRRPAPLALLALKYQPPPARPPSHPPPVPKYRF